MEGELASWYELLSNCKSLTERDMKKLCDIVVEILIEESNVQPVRTPVTICGDIHGQFCDLKELFRAGGNIPDSSYIFMGDYVDRGYHSLETFSYLLVLKALYPDRITLLRGNHESRQITTVYGFYDEVCQKYGSGNVWKYCCRVFDHLSLAALVDSRILCVHGGLSPDVKTVDQVRVISRAEEIPQNGPLCDLMWSDPEEIETWQVNARGAGWLFGRKVTLEFSKINGIELICRAHQLVQEGYKYSFPERSLVTVWSAPNYCYRCGNVASILALDTELNREFKIFNAVPDTDRIMPAKGAGTSNYFL